jgi:hypothetical protein
VKRRATEDTENTEVGTEEEERINAGKSVILRYSEGPALFDG